MPMKICARLNDRATIAGLVTLLGLFTPAAFSSSVAPTAPAAPAAPAAAQTTPVPLPSNCFIRITSRSLGAKKAPAQRLQSGTHLNNRNECRALARIHQANAALDTTARKKVVFKWVGEGSRRKG
jgi:hypothetical protein